MEALNAGDSEKLASVLIPEEREGAKEAQIPNDSISNATIEKISETIDRAEVTAEYDVEIIIESRAIEGHVKVSISLEKRGDVWLISNMEPIETVQDSVEVLVHDEAENLIAGAKVTIGSAQEEIIRTEITNASGLAIFEKIPAPDNIIATLEGYTPSTGWGMVFGQPYKVRLESVESLYERREHAVLTVVDPPILFIAQDGSAKAIATVYSFDRPSRVAVQLQEGFEPSLKFHLESTPEDVMLPDTGQAEIQLTIRVGSAVEPGIYRINVKPTVSEDLRQQGEGEGYGAGGATLIIKVKAP